MPASAAAGRAGRSDSSRTATRHRVFGGRGGAVAVTALTLAATSIGWPTRPLHAGQESATAYRGIDAQHPVLERAVREFRAVDLHGRAWSFDHLVGRVVLIDFWATWCAPCLAELPRIRTLRERYGDRGFEILGVSLDVRDRRSLVSWLQRHGIGWPQVHDGRGRAGDLPRRFGVIGIPMSVLVDHAGRVAGVNLRGEALERSVVALVAGSNARR